MTGRERITDNPFYVLALPTTCTRAEAERAGQKWLAMLEVGLEAAQTYATPLGGMPRDADLVRRSMDALRDPDKRLLHELWAGLSPSVEHAMGFDVGDQSPTWPEALVVLGWAPR